MSAKLTLIGLAVSVELTIATHYCRVIARSLAGSAPISIAAEKSKFTDEDMARHVSLRSGILEMVFMRSPMRYMLKLLILIARIKRRRPKKQFPHWLRDAFDVFQYLNFIALLPTLLAMSLAPAHFYRRLPVYLRLTTTWVQTPVKFLTTAAAFAALIFSTLVPLLVQDHSSVSSEDLSIVIVVIALTCPLWLPIICIFFYIVLFFIPVAGSRRGAKSFRTLLLIPVSPMTYFNLNFGRYAWAILYFGIYFCFTFYFWVATIDLAYWGLSLLPSQEVGLTLAILKVQMWGLLVVIGFVILVWPYVQLLRLASRSPTGRMHRADAYAVQEIVRGLSFGVMKRDSRQRQILVAALGSTLVKVKGNWVQQEVTFGSLTEEKRKRALEIRRCAYAKVVKIDRLEWTLVECDLDPKTKGEVEEFIREMRLLLDLEAPQFLGDPWRFFDTIPRK